MYIYVIFIDTNEIDAINFDVGKIVRETTTKTQLSSNL